MRSLIITVAAAALGVAVALPAAAQVGVEIGTPGVGVHIGDPDYRVREERRRTRVYRDDNRGECRTVTVRRERDDGTVITRRERRCD
jgi:hypothetical protein